MHHKFNVVSKKGLLGEGQMHVLYSVFKFMFIEINGLQKDHTFSCVPGYLIWTLCNELECLMRAGSDDTLCPSAYTSKCVYEPVLRPSDNFVISGISMISGVLSNQAPKLTEEQKSKLSWHFKRGTMNLGGDEVKQSRIENRICFSWPTAGTTARNIQEHNSSCS